jgi:hypothetical protein
MGHFLKKTHKIKKKQMFLYWLCNTTTIEEFMHSFNYLRLNLLKIGHFLKQKHEKIEKNTKSFFITYAIR